MLHFALLFVAGSSGVSAADPSEISQALAKHCGACHASGKKKGQFSIEGLNPNAVQKNAEAWKRVAERMDSGEMPPDDAPRVDPGEIKKLVASVTASLKSAGSSVEGLGGGPTGNRLDHALLFSGKATAQLDNPPRLWRLSPGIYATWVLKHHNPVSAPGQAMTPAGGDGFPDRSGSLSIDEGTLAVVLRNAQQIASKSAASAAAKPNSASRPAVESAIRTFVAGRRFGSVSDEQMSRYYGLYEKATAVGGHEAGLKAVFVAVQLQPEALFRLEFGLGSPDARGYRMLGSRELAYGISFAFGDAPQKSIFDAAAKGSLATRDDVAREVRAMLSRPPKDNPRVLRFFREYFAYTTATDVFKEKNEDHNPQQLVTDTDNLILWVLDRDRDVLKELLTTNTAFVASGMAPHMRETADKFKRGQIYRSYGLTAWPDKQPVVLPENERAGILTQPSWLVAMSGNFDNHPVQRGKWIREKLLGGSVPPVPITVNAQVPDDPTHTFRHRLTAVTKSEFCWQCHKRMNPLGLPFEQYDHFGRYRVEEFVVDPTKPATPAKNKKLPPIPVLKGLPADTTGSIDGTGDARLDGPVDTPVAMLKKLADSPRVRQVFVRHAFRYWMGRDENLGDAPTLIAADQAYVKSGGSLKALLESLLTSDSFLLRTPPPGVSP
ncbi:DUF1588 domain-containing protein [Gemmata sp.]|uniref:DUF1588 domain-containing protein n=1 Tax=Gemmata sp. TaxID=1914242 RepID=UPI003F71F0DF